MLLMRNKYFGFRPRSVTTKAKSSAKRSIRFTTIERFVII